MPSKDTDRWHELRRNMICGSEIGAFMGLDRGLSRKLLLETKAGTRTRKTESSFAVNMMEWGKQNEKVALACFAEAFAGTLGAITTLGSLQHVAVPRISGEPDAVLIGGGSGAYVPVEIKCRAYPDASRACPFVLPRDIPAKHVVQLQTYMELLDSEIGYLVSWSLNNGFAVFRFSRARFFFTDHLFPEVRKWEEGSLPLRLSRSQKTCINKAMDELWDSHTEIFCNFPTSFSWKKVL